MLLLGPGFAILSAHLCAGSDGNKRLRAGSYAIVAAWMGWIISGICAAVIFPRYPLSEFPPERYAILFTIPGFISGFTVVLICADRFRNLTPARVITRPLTIAFLVITVLLFYGAYFLSTTRTYRSLPWSASEIRQFYWGEDFLPDYTYHLKAKMREEEFEAFVRRHGLTLHSAERQYADKSRSASWSSAEKLKWWDPSASLEGTYVTQEGDGWVLAKYENGYLYYYAMNH
jgi:hypothetical protein